MQQIKHRYSVCLKEMAEFIKNCSTSELIPILSEFSELDESVIYSDCWKAYDGLVDLREEIKNG